MTPPVELTEHTFRRLQTHAVAFVDTPESVIIRMIDAYEKESGASGAFPEGGDGPSARMFNAGAPPDLTHAKILGVTFCGKPLERNQDNWNALLNAAVREAKARSKSAAEFRQLMVVNYIEGEKHDEGYRPLSGTSISVQGQDANGAWRAASHIARQLGCELSVKFAWREKEGAAFPGLTGQLTIAGKG